MHTVTERKLLRYISTHRIKPVAKVTELAIYNSPKRQRSAPRNVKMEPSEGHTGDSRTM